MWISTHAGDSSRLREGPQGMGQSWGCVIMDSEAGDDQSLFTDIFRHLCGPWKHEENGNSYSKCILNRIFFRALLGSQQN